MRKKSLIIVFLIILMIISVVIGCNGNKNPEEPTRNAPVITVTGVPTTGYQGRTSTIPAATANDEVDGDITSSLKVDVNALKADGTMARQMLYQASANKTNEFTPAVAYSNYEIVYYVKNSAGISADAKFSFTTIEDTEPPVITITESNFNITTGKIVDDINGFILPKATGIDQPGDVDITSNIKVSAKKDGETVAIYNYQTEYPQFLVAGSYTLEYNLLDGAKNAATPVSFPLVINNLDKTGLNLLSGSYGGKTVQLGKDSKFNDLAELQIGKTSEHGDSDMSAATFRTAKIGEEYLGITVNIDPYPASGGESFYTINYINSKNKNLSTPDGSEGSWASSIQLRIEASRSIVMIKGGDGGSAGGKPDSTIQLRDGKDHTLYFKFDKQGTNSTDANAKIIFKVWIDTLPTSAPTINAEMTRAEEYKEGGYIEKNDFDEIWNNPEGYLNFSAYSPSKDETGKYNDDMMRVKSIAIYNKNETEFATDITAPIVTASAPEFRYIVNQKITFNSATAIDETDGEIPYNIFIFKPDGTRLSISSGTREFTPTEIGTYTIIYYANDSNTNVGYVKYTFRVTINDRTAPDLNLSSENVINAIVGEAFALPTATAIDDNDGDVTSNIILSLKGPENVDNIFAVDVPTMYTLYAQGTYTLTYKVMDSSWNESTKEVTVIVTGLKTGNLVSQFTGYNSQNNALSLVNYSSKYSEQKVYEEKVSIVLNMKNNEGLFFIQARGSAINTDWPKGVIFSIAGDKITVYAGGINTWGLGQFENPFSDVKNMRQNVKFEYQITQEIYKGIEYMRIRVWFCEEELTPVTTYNSSNSSDPRNYSFSGAQLQAFVGESINGDGLFCTVNEIPSSYPIDASYPIFSAVNDRSVDILEFRIDGASVETEWSKPTAPLGFELPEFNDSGMQSNIPDGQTVTVNSGDHGYQVLTTGQKVASTTETSVQLETAILRFSFKHKEGSQYIDYRTNNNYTLIKLLGPTISGQWASSGLNLQFYHDKHEDNEAEKKPEIAISIGTTKFAWIDYNSTLYKNWQNQYEIILKATITYVLGDDGFVTGIKLGLWVGVDNNGTIQWESTDIYLWNQAEGVELINPISEKSDTILIPIKYLGDLNAYTPNGISALTLGDTDLGHDNAEYKVEFYYAKAEEN